jgi:hypothetical protein
MKKLVTLFALSVAASAAHATLVFDNASNFRNSVAGATGTSTGSTPNTFMGGAYNLLSGTTSITGFDLFPVNLSGTNFTALKINLFVWGTVNTGTVSASAPAFSNLLGSYTATSTGAYTTGFYFPFQGNPALSTSGFTLGTPLALNGATSIGLTFNYQGTTDGVTFSNVNSLTSLISTGTPATVGSNVFNGYYRNANSETNGNFTSTLRTLGLTDQSVAVRVYGNTAPVPEPASMVALGLGTAAMLRRRKKA